MEARAHLSHARITPRKVKIVCDLIRGKDTKTAVAILMNTPNAAAELLLKLVNSAVANAENNHFMRAEKLYVSEVWANEGPIMKRMKARSRGQGSIILKRSSHLSVVLKERA